MAIAFVMDPLTRVNPATDTSFAFMRAAQAAGHPVLHVAPRDLALDGDQAAFWASPVTLTGDPSAPFQVAAPSRRAADSCHAIFIRTDPPFNVAYLEATWILSLAEARGVRVVNSPTGIRSANEKLYALNFAAFCPETLVTANRGDIRAFVARLGGEAIAKPTDGHGGFGVVRLRVGDSNLGALIDLLTQEGARPIIVQAFLAAASQGDKRLLMVNGQLRGAVRRVPSAGDHRSNVHVGGQVEACPIDPADVAIAAAVGPRLRQDGLTFVGLDVIGDRLIEVNVTSPTLVQELHRLGGPDLAAEVIASLG